MIDKSILKAATLICCCFFFHFLRGQDSIPQQVQTLLLRELNVEAFRSNKPVSETPAAIGLLSSLQLKYNDATSLQNALNTVPGVIMESRGYGGSQRINIRGNFLRSPFAVRNVKMYFNGIPISSPDGTAPLEVMDAFDLEGIEIIKGPAGSIYGSGTGGVMLFTPQSVGYHSRIKHSTLIGDFGLKRFTTAAELRLSDKTDLRMSHIFQENEGYRDQEFNRKQNVSLFLNHRFNEKHKLFWYATYFNGHLALPGALVAAQVEEDPTQANAFSIANNASLYRERFFSGVSHIWQITKRLNLTTAVYGMTTDKTNPYGTAAAYTRNGFKREGSDGTGGRLELTYNVISNEKHKLKTLVGTELQYEQFSSTEWRNRLGAPGDLKYNYDVNFLSSMAFASVDYTYKEKLFIHASSSLNQSLQEIDATGFDNTRLDSTARLSSELLPRLAVSYAFNGYLKPFASVSFGNSNPTVFEQVEIQQFGSATGFASSTGLRSERGINYEVGVKGTNISNISYELSAYHFELQDAILPIVQEQFFAGTNAIEEFTLYNNAGSILQRGVEGTVQYEHWKRGSHTIISNFKCWLTGQITNYRFQEYALGDENFEGNLVPGMPQYSLSSGFTLLLLNRRLRWSVQHYYFDKIVLNNTNTDFSNPYHLVNTRFDWEWPLRRSSGSEKAYGQMIAVFFGINNCLNAEYTSFLQTNAVAQRYYNPAPPLNFYGGLQFSIGKE